MSETGTTPPSRREILEALGRYQKQGAVTVTSKELSDMLQTESDRGVIVFLGSILEDILLIQLKTKFVKLAGADQKNLTRSGGLLANFDDRINLAHAMGLLSRESVGMLQVFKALRNACAHSRKTVSFKTPEIRVAMSLLFEGEGAEDIRSVVTNSMVLRFAFLSAFVYMVELIIGRTEDEAQKRAAEIMNSLTVEIAKAQTK